MGVKSLLVRGASDASFLEKTADVLLFFPRLFMGKRVTILEKGDDIFIGRRILQETTERNNSVHGSSWAIRGRNSRPSNDFTAILAPFEFFSGNGIGGGLSLIAAGVIGAVVAGVLAAAATVVVGAGLGVMTGIGLALKKITVETSKESKAYHLAVDKFIELEKVYKTEKGLVREIESKRSKINGINQEIARQKEWLQRNRKPGESPELKADELSWIQDRENKIALLQREIKDLKKNMDDLAVKETDLRKVVDGRVREYKKVHDSKKKTQDISPAKAILSDVPTSLHMAIRARNLDLAQKLLQDPNCDCMAMDKNGSTPLHDAAKAKVPVLTKLLLQRGADPNARNHKGQTPLELAIEVGASSTCEVLLKSGKQIDLVDSKGDSLILKAISMGRPTIVKHLLDYSPEILAAKDPEEEPLLVTAFKNNGLQSALALLRAGATDLQAVSPAAFQATIKEAIKHRDYEGLSEMFEYARTQNYSISLNDSMKNEEHTLLGFAVNYGDSRIVELLIKNGADVNLANKRGNTPLHLAVSSGQIKMTELLLKHGAQISKSNHYEETPFDLAMKLKDFHVATVIMMSGQKVEPKNQKGVPYLCIAAKQSTDAEKINGLYELSPQLLESRDKTGKTPLLIAAEAGNFSAVKVLLSLGADVRAVSKKEGTSVLHLAAGCGSSETFREILSQLGDQVDINQQDKDGRTPLHFLLMGTRRRRTKKADKEIFEKLISAGADKEIKDKFKKRADQYDSDGSLSRKLVVQSKLGGLWWDFVHQ